MTNSGARAPVYDSAQRLSPFLEEFRELLRYRELVTLWTVRNTTLRYKRSVLGVFWTLLEPLMLMVILSFVFSRLFRFSLENYPVYILSGLLVFDFFSRSTSQMVDEIIASQNLSQRIYFPRSAFALASILSYLVNWTFALLPLIGIMIALGQPLSWSMLLAPIAMLLTGLFALGVGLVVATLGAFFHDIKLTYGVLLSAWFYATPVIYPAEIVPERWAFLYRLNPMHYLVDLFRRPIYLGVAGSAQEWSVGFAIGLASAVVGWWLFTRWRRAFEYRV